MVGTSTSTYWIGMTLLIMIGLAIAVALIGATRYQRRLRTHRGLARPDFISEFSGLGVPERISGAVYDYYVSESRDVLFAVGPDDRIQNLFQRCREDVDDDALEILKTLDLGLPDQATLYGYARPVNTIREMVLWVDWIRQQRTEPG